MISLIDSQKFFISDLNGSGTIVSEMVKCGANLVLEWKVDFPKKFVHGPKLHPKTFMHISSQNLHIPHSEAVTPTLRWIHINMDMDFAMAMLKLNIN